MDLNIGASTLSHWLKETSENVGKVTLTDSGNYGNELEKVNEKRPGYLKKRHQHPGGLTEI